MVSAVGASATSSVSYTTEASTAGIDAQIAQYKKELADCVNCASADTPEGKAAIQEAQTKISAAEARIEKVHAAQPSSQAPEPSTATRDKDPDATIGRLLDVFA